MINANELRIGNYVNGSTGVERIIGIKAGVYEHDNPIPLTPEVFSKTNLVTKGDGLFCSPPHIQEASNKDLGTKYLSFWFNTRLNRWMEVQTRICVDYLHEVQNLYFVATKEELEINLDE